MAPQPVPHQNPYGERISLELAKEIAEAGEAFAAKQGWNATIAICDDGGHLVLLHRMSNGQFGSVDLAPPKAYGAAAFRRSTGIFHDDLAEGKFNTFWHLRQEAAIPLEGGYPIIVDGKVIGGHRRLGCRRGGIGRRRQPGGAGRTRGPEERK